MRNLTDNELRRLLILKRDSIKSLMVGPQQIRVYRWLCGRGATTSSEITQNFGWSAPQTCAVMNKLFDRGYVKRRTVEQDSGGHEYEYKPAVAL